MSLHLCDFCLADTNPTVEELQGKRQELEAKSVVPWEEQGVACCCCCLTYQSISRGELKKKKKKKRCVKDQGHVPGFLSHSPQFRKTQEPQRLKLLKRNYFTFATFNFDISML